MINLTFKSITFIVRWSVKNYMLGNDFTEEKVFLKIEGENLLKGFFRPLSVYIKTFFVYMDVYNAIDAMIIIYSITY